MKHLNQYISEEIDYNNYQNTGIVTEGVISFFKRKFRQLFNTLKDKLSDEFKNLFKNNDDINVSLYANDLNINSLKHISNTDANSQINFFDDFSKIIVKDNDLVNAIKETLPKNSNDLSCKKFNEVLTNPNCLQKFVDTDENGKHYKVMYQVNCFVLGIINDINEDKNDLADIKSKHFGTITPCCYFGLRLSDGAATNLQFNVNDVTLRFIYIPEPIKNIKSLSDIIYKKVADVLNNKNLYKGHVIPKLDDKNDNIKISKLLKNK